MLISEDVEDKVQEILGCLESNWNDEEYVSILFEEL